MPNNDVAASRFMEHAGRNFSSECAFFFPVHVLTGNADFSISCRFNCSLDRRKRRRHHDIAIIGVRDERRKRRKKRACVGNGLIHFPIAGDHPTPHRILILLLHLDAFYFSVSASTPGSFRPPRNSSEAPPPVEMCEILSATPDWWTAATESPPPTMEVAPPSVALATALAMASGPFANAGISKTPIGRFYTIVFAYAISAPY